MAMIDESNIDFGGILSNASVSVDSVSGKEAFRRAWWAMFEEFADKEKVTINVLFFHKTFSLRQLEKTFVGIFGSNTAKGFSAVNP